MSRAPRKTDTLTVRLNPELRERLDHVSDAFPYEPTITSIVERGLDLALTEMEEFIQRAKRNAP